MFSTVAFSQVVLTPAETNLNIVESVDDSENTNDGGDHDEKGLFIGDRLICNQEECYDKVFQPSKEWKEVRPSQRLPAGLDIRINLETGLKEAKLLDESEQLKKTDQVHSAEISTLTDDVREKEEEEEEEEEEEAAEETVVFKWNDAKESETADETHQYDTEEASLDNIKESEADIKLVEDKAKRDKELSVASQSKVNSEYEFFKDFENIKSLISLSSEDKWDEMESILDDLVEFAHDYKHGFKIISNEFETLEALSFNETVPAQIRELAARIIVSSLRNNPPSIDFINENFPETTSKLCQQLSKLYTNRTKILVKRFLSILDVLLSRADFVSVDDAILWDLYQNEDPLIKVKVLEIVTKVYHDDNVHHLEKHQDSSKATQKWANELTDIIQSPDIDEYQLRSFFNSICFLKKQFGSRIKVDSDFLNWLIDEVKSRKEKGKDELYKRDADQLEFDKKFIDSRHSVFGNPKAERIKIFEEEDDIPIADEL